AIDAPEVWRDFTIDGTGTRVAVIDTGASWLHPSLWRASSEEYDILTDGSHFYVDIDDDSVIDSDEGPINTVTGQSGSSIDYSEDYMFIDIGDNGRFDYSLGDRWLGGIDANDNTFIDLASEKVVILGESKVAILYDQTIASVFVRGVNLTDAVNIGDTNGHGTHVASTIAGGQIGMINYVGVAPGADLIIIKSPLDSESVLDGIAFAAENDADVINMSFSSYLGFLDGTDLEDLAISEAFLQYGTLSTLAAGNLGGRPKHASFTVASGEEESATFNVQNPPDYSFLNILWRSDNDDEHIILTPPNSEEQIDLGSFNEILRDPFEINHANISAYVFPDQSIKGMNRIIVQVSAQDHFWANGGWTLTVSNPTGDAITVHAYAWDNNWGGTALRFTSKIDYTHLISSPGTSDLGITVASYNEVTLDISSSSSIGPRVDEVVKPTVTAPGDQIRAAYNSVVSLWVSRSGTSMAAPHVAGVVALIKAASGDSNGWRTLSALLEGSGGSENHYNTPSMSWGFGMVNPVWSVQHVLSPYDSVHWNGVPLLASDTLDPILPSSLDFLNASVYLTNESTWYKIGFRGTPDFSSDNIFTLNWDTDNSMASGSLGVDLKVNISNGIARTYEWQSGSFVDIGVVDWSNSSNNLYFSLDHILGVDFGRVEFQCGDNSNSSIDTISTATLANQWSPLIESFSIEFLSDDVYSVSLEISDRDTDSSLLDIELDVVDGGLTSLDTLTESGKYLFVGTVDISEITVDEMLSLLLSVSDSLKDLIIPPILLSGGSSLKLEITEGFLDHTVVRVGLFISERITGNFSVRGYLLAAEVRLSLQLTYGLTFNMTLLGSNGEYTFDVSTYGLVSGIYDVHAVAISQDGAEVSLLIGQLTLVEDYSYAILIGGIGIGVLVVFLYIWRTQKNH
ncbi:MAG: S8 family serine peptidase, partial [Candidatus Thorarchaeota archaeon]